MYTKSDRIIRESCATTSKHIKTDILAKVSIETYAFLHSTQWMAQSSLWRIGIAHTSSSTAHSLQAKDCKARFRYCESWSDKITLVQLFCEFGSEQMVFNNYNNDNFNNDKFYS